jgi:hypothetical protein
MAKEFAVIYRTGGTLNFCWRRITDNFTDHEAAGVKAADLHRMGYPALIFDAKLLDSVGLPETFDYVKALAVAVEF